MEEMFTEQELDVAAKSLTPREVAALQCNAKKMKRAEAGAILGVAATTYSAMLRRIDEKVYNEIMRNRMLRG